MSGPFLDIVLVQGAVDGALLVQIIHIPMNARP
jgi:hypothetical protein